MSVTELRFLTQFQNMQNLMQAKKSFEELHPDVKIVIEQSTDNFETIRACQSDTPPDLVDSGGWEICNRQGLFIDLMPYVKETEGLEEDINPGLMRLARKDGVLPVLPIDVALPLILISPYSTMREWLTPMKIGHGRTC